MFRRTINRVGTALVLGGFLVVIYLFKDITDNKSIHLDEDVRKNGNHIKPLTKGIFSACQQNVSAANISGFSTLSIEIQDFLYYRHCHHFPMLLDVPDKCGSANEPADIFLLLVIKTSPVNYERREVLRKTWAKERLHNGVWIRRLFLIGTMGDGYEKENLNKLLQLEQLEHKDILQWDFKDSFFNLTLKQIVFLQWLEMNCHKVHFLLNGDDDVFANTDNIVEYLQSLKDNNGSEHHFTGDLITNAVPVRWSGSKYYVPVQVHESNSYPPYCGGGGYLMSFYTALVIYNMSQSITIMPIDDVYIGMCLARANLTAGSHTGVKTLTWYISSNKLNKYDPCYFREILLMHRLIPSYIYYMWHSIHDPNLKCNPSNKLLMTNLTFGW